MRGGAHDPLPQAELEGKFLENCLFGGWTAAQAASLQAVIATLFDQPNLSSLSEFRL